MTTNTILSIIHEQIIKTFYWTMKLEHQSIEK
jgi:hypothetical protein